MKTKKIKNLSIKQLLITTGIIASVLLFAIAIFTKYSLDTTLENYELLNSSKNLLISELKMRKAEKDFISKETINSAYFETGESKYLNDFENEYKIVLQTIKKMQKQPDLKHLKLENELSSIEEHFFNYRELFLLLVSKLQSKGYKDFGLEGQMRNEIHEVERSLEKFNDIKAEYFMLMLRRHEKDYLLRKELKYKEQFLQEDSKFTAYIQASGFEQQQKQHFLDLLDNYKSLFFKIIEHDYAIGINNSSGLLTLLNNQVTEIEQSLFVIETRIYETHKQKVNKTITLLFAIISFFSIGIVLLIFKTTRIVIKPLNKLKRHIHLLGEGQLPENLHIEGKNELTEMTESLNILTENLKNTKEFAIEVGKGKLDTQINVFNNQGDLGGSLIQMRNELIIVAQERELQNINHQNRLWANQTLNEVNEFLRTKTDIEELSYSILNVLIKQTNSNQGALFLKSEDDEKMYEISAIQAYGRKKFSNKKVKLGEDLIGTCAIEKETIYMTDLPKDYIQISSGLGFANPNELVLVPMKNDNEVLGVIEIASFKKIEKHQIEVLEKSANNYASALYSIRQNKKTQELLESSNYQANELEAQSEELRQNMEELSAIQEALHHNEDVLKQRIAQIEEEKDAQINQLNEEFVALQQNYFSNSETLNLISNLAFFAELLPNATFISASKKLLKTLQTSSSEIVKKSIRDYMEIDEQINFEIEWKKILNGEMTENTTKLHLKNGKIIVLYNHFSVFKINKKTEKILVFSRIINNDMEKALFKEIETMLC